MYNSSSDSQDSPHTHNPIPSEKQDRLVWERADLWNLSHNILPPHLALHLCFNNSTRAHKGDIIVWSGAHKIFC